MTLLTILLALILQLFAIGCWSFLFAFISFVFCIFAWLWSNISNQSNSIWDDSPDHTKSHHSPQVSYYYRDCKSLSVMLPFEPNLVIWVVSPSTYEIHSSVFFSVKFNLLFWNSFQFQEEQESLGCIFSKPPVKLNFVVSFRKFSLMNFKPVQM